MTSQKRITVTIPEELDRRILELRKDERFIRCSYGEIMRTLIQSGLKHENGSGSA